MQAEEPELGSYFPATQLVHPGALAAENFPAEHSSQLVAPRPFAENVPIEHGKQSEEATAAEYFPKAQAMHVAGAEAPRAAEKRPAEHSVHATEPVAT